MNCNKCGTEIYENEKFCRECGTPINQNVNPKEQNEQQDINNDYSRVNKAVDFISNTKDHTEEYETTDIASAKGISAIAYLGILFFIPLIAKPESKFAKFHANQGLVFFISSAVLQVLRAIIQTIIKSIFTTSYYGFTYVSSTGRLIVSFIAFAVDIIILLWFILGLVNALSGKAKDLPIIGKIRIIK